MENVIGKLPDFTTDDSVGSEKVEEVKEAPVVEEKETPTELPTENKPDDIADKPTDVVEDTETVKQVNGLLSEREKLLQEIQDLREKRRNLRQEETKEVIVEVSDKLDDLNPEDINNIDRVLKAKGYITKEESKKILYENAKNEALNSFLEKYPEYKPENDPNDVNWNALQRELSFYKMPENSKLISSVLEKAHRGITVTVDKSSNETKRRIATAQKGGGGIQKSSSGKRLSPQMRRHYEEGGWSEEEIKELES